MTKLPLVSGGRLIGIPEKLGFEISRSCSSHYVMRHPDCRRTVVPVHGNTDIGRPLLRRILREAEVETAVYISMLDS